MYKVILIFLILLNTWTLSNYFDVMFAVTPMDTLHQDLLVFTRVGFMRDTFLVAALGLSGRILKTRI